MSSKFLFFVEGQTEMIFLHNLLANTIYDRADYHRFGYSCISLFGKPIKVALPKSHNTTADVLFVIVDMEGDGNAEKHLLSRLRSGQFDPYTQAFILMDMYGDAYRELCKKLNKSSEVDLAVCDQRRESMIRALKKGAGAERAAKLKLHFAIMEVESWLVGCWNALLEKYPALPTEYQIGDKMISLETAEPEADPFYHPTEVVPKCRTKNRLE